MVRRSRTVGARRGWSRWDESEARAALDELAASGESTIRFARRKGFSDQRLRYWKKRLGAAPPPVAFVAVRLPDSPRVRDTIEIRVDGLAVHVREDLDVAHVARLVEALAKRTRGC